VNPHPSRKKGAQKKLFSPERKILKGYKKEVKGPNLEKIKNWTPRDSKYGRRNPLTKEGEGNSEFKERTNTQGKIILRYFTEEN